MGKRKKIGIISYYNLNKLDNGGKIRNHNIAKELAKLGHFVYVLMPDHHDKTRNRVQPYISIPVKIKWKNHLSKIIALSLIGLRYFRRYKIDYIIAEHAWTLPIGIILSFFLKKPLILDEHNIEFLRAKELNKLIRFMYAIILEKIFIQKCDLISFVSFTEKEIIRKITHSRITCIVVPNGSSIIPEKRNLLKYVECNNMIKEKFKLDNKKMLALFIGDLFYKPNKDAVKILKIIAEATPNIQFLIVGRHDKLDTSKTKNLLFTGYVDSLLEFLYGCDITVSPMISGGGTNLKVLEALTVGLPILSTSYALRGIELKKCNNVIVSDNFDEYPNILRNYHKNILDGKIQRIIDKSRHWQKSIMQLCEFIETNRL